MLIWPLLVFGSVLAGLGVAGVLWWWPDPFRCLAAAGLVLAGAVIHLVAASARFAVPDGDVAAVALLVLGSVHLAALVARGHHERQERSEP